MRTRRTWHWKEAPLDSAALRRQGLTIVATLAIAYVASNFFRASNVTIGLDLMRDLHIGPEALGALTGAFFFGFSAMQIPCGFFFDRYGPRRTVSGMLLLAVAGAALAQAQFGTAAEAKAMLEKAVAAGVFTAGGMAIPRRLGGVRGGERDGRIGPGGRPQAESDKDQRQDGGSHSDNLTSQLQVPSARTLLSRVTRLMVCVTGMAPPDATNGSDRLAAGRT